MLVATTLGTGTAETARAPSVNGARLLSVAQRFLTVAEAAEVLRLSESTIRAAIKRGEFGSVRIGKHLRIPMSELERLVREPDSRP